MNKKEIYLKELEMGLMQRNSHNLKEINIQKDQEVVLSEFYIIIKGEI